MKIIRVIVIAMVLAIVLLALWLLGVPLRVDASFASEAHLKDMPSIDVVVTDAKDVEALKDVLSGWAIGADEHSWFDGDCDSPSITLTNGRKSIVFYPCWGNDPRVEVEHTEKFRNLSHTQKVTLDRVCKKYGMVMP